MLENGIDLARPLSLSKLYTYHRSAAEMQQIAFSLFSPYSGYTCANRSRRSYFAFIRRSLSRLHPFARLSYFRTVSLTGCASILISSTVIPTFLRFTRTGLDSW